MDESASAFFDSPPHHQSHKALARHQRKAAKEAKRAGPKPLEAKTPRQAEYIALLRDGESTFAVGGAGTGKTYIAARIGAQAMIAGHIDRIVVGRATVSKEKHRMGFLPGGPDQKLAPWLVPVRDGLRAEVSAQTLKLWEDEGKIEYLSFEHIRGRTLSKAFVILDEAQNCDFGDLVTFLTRIGEGTQVVVTGDQDQVDIHNSGLEDFLDLVEEYDIPMSIVEFEPGDVVRSKLAKAIVQAVAAKREREEAEARARRDKREDVTNLDSTPSFLNTPRRVSAGAKS